MNQLHCAKCEATGENKPHFICPTDGLIHQDDIIFNCNTCRAGDMIEAEGLFMCPTCLTGDAESLVCRRCNSTEITPPSISHNSNA